MSLPCSASFALSALILALATSCGCGAIEEDAPKDYERLELEPVFASLEAPKVELYASIGDLGGVTDCKDWTLEGANFEFLEPKSGRVLKVGRARPVQIRIPIDLRFTSACEVTVRLIARVQPFGLTGSLIARGEVIAQSSADVGPWKNQQEIALRFSSEESAGKKIDHISLDLSPGVDPVFLYSVSIEDVSPGGRAPSGAYGGWELVEIGTDARRSTFLAPARTMTVSYQVDRPQLSLRFSQAATAEFHDPTGGPLWLRIKGEAEDAEQLSLSLRPSEFLGWEEATVSLDPWLGEEISIEFELDAAAKGYRALSQPVVIAHSATPPTVLLITSDTHRADHLGFLMEEGALRTDAIDELASRGLVFTDAIASINNTTPSHVTLMTGLSPRDTGVIANALPISDAAPTLAEAFRDKGYATLAAVSASPVSYRYCGLGQGFDRYSGPGERSARDSSETFRELDSWLPDYAGAPLFLWVHIYDAHGPYEPPEDYKRLYYPEGVDPYFAEEGAPPARVPYWDRGLKDSSYANALYRSEITYQDELLQSFLARARFKNSIIAFTADHGETLDRGLEKAFGHLSLTYNTLAIPLIVVAPGLTSGERSTAPVEQVDVGRTLLNLAGHPDVEFPGRDLLTESEGIERPRFSVQSNGDGVSVLLGRWLLLLNLTGRQEDWGPPEETMHAVRLFDVREDPFCERDVSSERPHETRRLRALVIDWLGKGAQSSLLSEVDGSRLEIQRQLEELGYTASDGAGSASSWIDPDCDCARCAEFR
jgi:arylsulfatase A-like enzyme